MHLNVRFGFKRPSTFLHIHDQIQVFLFLFFGRLYRIGRVKKKKRIRMRMRMRKDKSDSDWIVFIRSKFVPNDHSVLLVVRTKNRKVSVVNTINNT